jgi:hypothetical protein
MGSSPRLPVPEDESACFCATCLRAIAVQIDAGKAHPDAR